MHLNTNGQNIKLTHVISRTSTGVNCKSTSVNALLHASSFHPTYTVHSIPTGQFLRMKWICSIQERLEKQSTDLKAQFRQRGYKTIDIEKAYNRANNTDRMNLLGPQKWRTSESQVRFITNYNSQWRNLYSTFEQFWPVLQTDPDLRLFVSNHPQMIAKRFENIGRYVSQEPLCSGKGFFLGASWSWS